MDYDFIIIGTGAAGYSAAIYAKRFKLNTLIIGKELGGTAIEAATIENWPGIKKISGVDLMNRFEQHAKSLGIKIIQEEVVEIQKNKDKTLTITTKKNKQYKTKTVLLATGTKRRKLNVPGEDKFLGKGVAYCAICDAPLFKNKTVAVIGGSNSTAKSALILAEYAKKIYIIYRKEKLRAEPIMVERIEKNKKIEVISNSNVIEILGDKLVNKIKLDTGKELEIQGIFIEIGTIPLSSLVERIGVKLTKQQEIIVNKTQETNVPGIFAAGDVTASPNKFRQIITAAAEGSIASASAYRYIQNESAK